MTWFAARNLDGSLASINRNHMAGYNDEELADSDPAVVAFLAAAQSKPSPVDARLWIERLPPAKRQAIWTAALANPAILGWLFLASGAQAGIDLTNPDTIAGVAALVAAGILTPADQAVLLAP